VRRHVVKATRVVNEIVGPAFEAQLEYIRVRQRDVRSRLQDTFRRPRNGAPRVVHAFDDESVPGKIDGIAPIAAAELDGSTALNPSLADPRGKAFVGCVAKEGARLRTILVERFPSQAL
jgi:hypothetical protein